MSQHNSSLKLAYDDYLDSPLWPVIEKALEDLEGNKDFIRQTSMYHLTGYIVKQLESKK